MWEAINKKVINTWETPADKITEILFVIVIVVAIVLGVFGWLVTY